MLSSPDAVPTQSSTGLTGPGPNLRAETIPELCMANFLVPSASSLLPFPLGPAIAHLLENTKSGLDCPSREMFNSERSKITQYLAAQSLSEEK